jgi:phosphate transport system substrate-binding protein
MKTTTRIAAAILGAVTIGTGSAAVAQAREAVLATGSSTVAPFTRTVAETLAASGAGKVEVRSVGTVYGFDQFCQGGDLRHPDVQNASRRMNALEFQKCLSRGVNEIMEIPIGHDGIVVAHRKDLPSPNFTLAQLWLGIAKEIPQGGRLVPNPHTSWRQVAAGLPDWPIAVIGPPPTSGTRDSFTDLVLSAGCQAVPEVRAIDDAAQRRRLCTTVREDGRWTDGGEDDGLIVRRVTEGAPGTLGIFGYGVLEIHRDRIEGARIEGVDDTPETIASGAYPVARPLFVYVKRANAEAVPALRAFLAEYVSDRAMGPGGYLVRRGLVPLDPARLRRVQEAVRNQEIMLRGPGT